MSSLNSRTWRRQRQNPIDEGMPWLRTGKTNAKSLKTVFTGYGIEYHPCHVNGRRNFPHGVYSRKILKKIYEGVE